mmetsp:Transcript_64717/g.179815  ORF Transcript_64717/g.179815 Transcript_64717/m.179815 type:complete len:265 (-) Transcript_64717:1075-1869(-)
MLSSKAASSHALLTSDALPRSASLRPWKIEMIRGFVVSEQSRMHVTASRPVGRPTSPLLLDLAGLGNGSARVRFELEPAMASYRRPYGERRGEPDRFAPAAPLACWSAGAPRSRTRRSDPGVEASLCSPGGEDSIFDGAASAGPVPTTATAPTATSLTATAFSATLARPRSLERVVRCTSGFSIASLSWSSSIGASPSLCASSPGTGAANSGASILETMEAAGGAGGARIMAEAAVAELEPAACVILRPSFIFAFRCMSATEPS